MQHSLAFIQTYTLHVHTVGGGKEYTLRVHTSGGGKVSGFAQFILLAQGGGGESDTLCSAAHPWPPLLVYSCCMMLKS